MERFSLVNIWHGNFAQFPNKPQIRSDSLYNPQNLGDGFKKNLMCTLNFGCPKASNLTTFAYVSIGWEKNHQLLKQFATVDLGPS